MVLNAYTMVLIVHASNITLYTNPYRKTLNRKLYKHNGKSRSAIKCLGICLSSCIAKLTSAQVIEVLHGPRYESHRKTSSLRSTVMVFVQYNGVKPVL